MKLFSFFRSGVDEEEQVRQVAVAATSLATAFSEPERGLRKWLRTYNDSASDMKHSRGTGKPIHTSNN